MKLTALAASVTLAAGLGERHHHVPEFFGAGLQLDRQLECGIRQLIFRQANTLPKDPQILVDALELAKYCGPTAQRPEATRPAEALLARKLEACEPFPVDGARDVHEAIAAARLSQAPCKVITLPPGVTFLNKTVALGPKDSGLTIQGSNRGQSWLSGGTLFTISAQDVERDAAATAHTVHVRVPASVADVPGLFGLEPHVRFQNARWPNGDTERDLWGYASPAARKVSVGAEQVREWIKPTPGEVPHFSFVDLRDAGNPTGATKRDSVMTEYNQYTSGRGGACDAMWDTSYGESYWCGNASAGGWAEVDQAFAKAGTVGLPVGLAYYANSTVGQRLASWSDPTGAVVHAWHGQSWFTNAWRVSGRDDKAGALTFDEGGSQGGRSWCRCDQCGYAGHWCRKGEPKDTRLISGRWYVEGVREELDAPGEFFFDAAKRMLHLVLGATAQNFELGPDGAALRSKELEVVVPRLETLIEIDGANAVSIFNVGFRDTRRTHLKKHGVPSGGDWALYRGAAVMVANSEGSSIQGCTFARLDGNGILLHERVRGAVLRRNDFAWLGASAMAAWGRTELWDGRAGTQPRGTLVDANVVREIGIYEKQSSAWFQAKACNTTLTNNLFFNLPRAAINFNDGFGGGNLVQTNLMFNTCRESGDHGVVNSWDRQPFLWDETGQYDFDTPPTVIRKNLMVANYGASQGVDNDDGSSFYHMEANIFVGDGFKMDYGGHDSVFRGNLVLVRPYDGQNCFNVDRFLPTHQHRFTGNRCAVLGCHNHCEELVGTFNGACDDPNGIVLANNTYFTKAANASVKCAGEMHPLREVQASFGKELGSTAGSLPSSAQLVTWAREMTDTW